MEIIEVSAEEYSHVIKAPYQIFGSAAFNALNKIKCDKVYYLLFKEGKYRLGIIGGLKNGTFHSPFSAPFNGFEYITSNLRLQYIENALKSISQWGIDNSIKSISIILPPSFYHFSLISKQVNCLWRDGFAISGIDLNYSFDLYQLDKKYLENIWYNARKNLRISFKSELTFHPCIHDKEKLLAYKIISKNRQSRGFPLRMSWKQVSDTAQIIPADFFIIKEKYEKAIASAIVFHVAKNIVQVIYWGDLQDYSKHKTMNFLSYKLFEYYKKEGIQIVDLGPSTEKSIPNYGLAEFKDSIGCHVFPKYTFTKTLD